MPNLFIVAGRQRVSKDGHNIPDDIQLRRFHLGVRNLAGLYRPHLDEWRLYDNTGGSPHLVAGEKSGVLRVVDPARLALIEQASSVHFMPDTPAHSVEKTLAFAPEEVTRRSLHAMRKAYADVILENKAHGLPIIQWRDDRGVAEVPAEQLEPFARRILEVDGAPFPEAEERAS